MHAAPLHKREIPPEPQTQLVGIALGGPSCILLQAVHAAPQPLPKPKAAIENLAATADTIIVEPLHRIAGHGRRIGAAHCGKRLDRCGVPIHEAARIHKDILQETRGRIARVQGGEAHQPGQGRLVGVERQVRGQRGGHGGFSKL